MAFQKGHEHGLRFGEGQSIAGNGRRKQIYTVLKDKGFAKEDIRAAYLELMHYDLAELQELVDRNKKKSVAQIEKEKSAVPALYSIVARSLIKANSKGEMRYIDKLIEQVIGRPHQTIDQKTAVVVLPASQEELEAKIVEVQAAQARLAEIKKQLNDGSKKNKLKR